MKTFFFGDHLILGEKIVRISDFGWKITLNFGEDNRIFEDLGPPPIKNPGYAYGTKIDAGPPKLGEVQTNQKKVFTQIWSYFLPKIRWRAKRKRSSLKFGPFFAQNHGRKKGKEEKNLVQKLTRQPQLFRVP